MRGALDALRGRVVDRDPPDSPVVVVVFARGWHDALLDPLADPALRYTEAGNDTSDAAGDDRREDGGRPDAGGKGAAGHPDPVPFGIYYYPLLLLSLIPFILVLYYKK